MEYTLTLSRAKAVLRQHDLLLDAPRCPRELTFPAIAYDSRTVAPGGLFVCKGLNFKAEYLQKALAAGAACYVAEQSYDDTAPALLVRDVRKALSVLAAEYYGHPADRLTLIGLTGTKGKTTTTYFIKNILDTALGHRTAVLSTVEMYTGGESTEAHLTTPESLELQQCFADTLAHGITHLTMEVSSQAYKQQRVYGVPFTVGLFLNLSEDHIGPLEHESFEDYFQCKLQLMKNCKLAVICRARNCGLHDQIQPRVNMFLPLEGKTLDELMPGFGEKTRYNIRLAARKGVTTRWAGAEALETFFRIYLETCERDGIGHRPPDYFARMMEAYGTERCRICLAEYEGEPLAAAVALHYGCKVFYIYGASSNEKRNLMPAYAMQAEMIRWACSLGVDFYDFGGVYSLQKENGLYRFKEGFCHAVGVTELAGEFDRVLSPFWYWAFLRGKPLLQKLRARRKK